MREYQRDTAVKLLVRTRDRLEATGWQQFASGPYHGPNCLTGALTWESDYTANATDNTEVVLNRAVDALEHATGSSPDQYGHPCTSLVHWNDLEWTDRGDVVLAITDAIKYVESYQLTSKGNNDPSTH